MRLRFYSHFLNYIYFKTVDIFTVDKLKTNLFPLILSLTSLNFYKSYKFKILQKKILNLKNTFSKV